MLQITVCDDPVKAGLAFSFGACPIGFNEEKLPKPPLDLETGLHGKDMAKTAYRSFYGVRKNAPIFVIPTVDHRNTWVIACLLGMIPHPSIKTTLLADGLSEEEASRNARDLIGMASLLDDACSGEQWVRLHMHEHGAPVLLWEQFHGGYQDGSDAVGMVNLWRHILVACPTEMLATARRLGIDRTYNAGRAAIKTISIDVALVFSDADGIDIWTTEVAPCILHLRTDGHLTIACRDLPASGRMFGEPGMIGLVKQLGLSDWSGDHACAFGPKGVRYTRQQATSLASKVAGLAKPLR